MKDYIIKLLGGWTTQEVEKFLTKPPVVKGFMIHKKEE